MDESERGKLYYMKEFREHLIQFLDELIEQFPQEPNFVLMRIFIKDQVPVHTVIGRFIRDILPYREQANRRDDQFFKQHPFLCMSHKEVEDVGRHNINYFTQLWDSDALDDNDRKIIWEWVDVFMEFGHKYYTQYGNIPGYEREDKK